MENEKLLECTFHPQTNDFSKVEKYLSPRFSKNQFEEDIIGKLGSDSKHMTSTKSVGIHRTVELYSLSKPHN